MQGGDWEPKLRVIGEETEVAAEVPRLGDEGVEEVVRLGAGQVRIPKEEAMWLAAEERKAFEARSIQPAVEEILSLPSLDESAEVLEKQWGEAQRRGRVLWGYLVLFGLLCAGAAIWSVRHLVANKDVAQQAIKEAADIRADEAEAEAAAAGMVESVERRVAEYLAAADPASLLQHLRRREQVEPLVKDWYSRNEYRATKAGRMRALQPVSLERRPFWVVVVATPDGDRNLLVEQAEDGKMLVDWETDVCYQPMPWDEFVTKRPDGLHDFRVNGVEDNYYSHEFHSSEQFRCLRLTAKGSEEYLFGYVRRGGVDEARVLQAIREANGRSVSLLLKLAYLPGSGARRSVSVVSVVSTRWCLVNE